MNAAAVLLLALALLAGCRRPAPPVPQPRYLVGQPYSLGGVWSYPREDFSLIETGLAAVMPDREPARRTANGEIFDPDALLAAHRTLQLPAIVTVTNLENGRQLTVRVNDRGPVQPGRVLGLARRAANLLGVPDAGGTQLRLVVQSSPSQALAAALPTNEARPQIAAAPREAVTAETLAPIPGTREVATIRRGREAPAFAAAAPDPTATPERLPERVEQVAAAPGRLVIRLGSFFRRDLAQRQAGRLAGLGASVVQTGAGRQAQYEVRIGPLPDVASADATLARVLAAGAPEARLTVE